MLMHTRGILIMTPRRQWSSPANALLDYSGSVSAEDNQGIGGYDRIMGLTARRNISLATSTRPVRFSYGIMNSLCGAGERFPRKAETTDPIDRDVQVYPHAREGGSPASAKSSRTKPIPDARVIRHSQVMGQSPIRTMLRWNVGRHAFGRYGCDLGRPSWRISGVPHRHRIEAGPRFGFVPADGPDEWTAGTLFPMSSKKVARAINSASNNRPVVIIANLSGFDGSPNPCAGSNLNTARRSAVRSSTSKGPMVFCVISRFHGGAYVVFSRALNEQLEVAALEGSYASVIGGAPAAAVVFAAEVMQGATKTRTPSNLSQAMTQAEGRRKPAQSRTR